MLRLNFIIFIHLLIPFQVSAFTNINDAYPSPKLKANEIVRLQLKAMQQNDVNNRGIEVTFRFASPKNKVQTGPLSNFIKLVKNPTYHHLLNHIEATFLDLKTDGSQAIQEVIIKTPKGILKGFRFFLSVQQGKTFKNCWMTDAVIPFDVLEV